MQNAMKARKMRELVLLEPVLEKSERPSLGQTVLKLLSRAVLALKSAITVKPCSFGEAEWRRLECRNEFATREGERMNHFGIR